MKRTPFIVDFRQVRSYRDALVMRKIRNECREFMTNDRRVIGYWKQLHFWWLLRGDHGWEAWLVELNQRPIGYGIVSQRHNATWVSGGLTKLWRGLGYGRALFSFLTNRAHRYGPQVYLEVLDTNTPAISTYRSLGYREIGRSNDIITMTKP